MSGGDWGDLIVEGSATFGGLPLLAPSDQYLRQQAARRDLPESTREGFRRELARRAAGGDPGRVRMRYADWFALGHVLSELHRVVREVSVLLPPAPAHSAHLSEWTVAVKVAQAGDSGTFH